MKLLRQFTQHLSWRPPQGRNSRVKFRGRPNAPADLQPGITEGGENFRTTAPEPLVTWPLDLDTGEVALGYHLIARSVSLYAKDLLFEYAFAPELTEAARREVWLNMCYNADVSPSNLNWIGAEGGVVYQRPPAEAQYAWFDFFQPDYEWTGHFDYHGQPDEDYLRHRIARLTVDLRTGKAQIGK